MSNVHPGDLVPPNYVERDPWVCPECFGPGCWRMGTALRPNGDMLVECARGHTWRELPVRLMQWSSVRP